MTDAKPRRPGLRAMIAALALCYAAAALAVLATARTSRGTAAPDRPAMTDFLEPAPLGR